MKQRTWLTALLALLTAVFILTASIALPILVRPFYSAHIEPLGLEDYGLTRAQIMEAYNETLDYLVGRSDHYSAGSLPFSPDGADHFRDVRGLFLLDLWAALLSGCALLAWAVFGRRSPLRPGRPFGRGFLFWGGAGLAGVLLLVGGLAALDFDRAFTLFHTLFFPGRDNWLFDWRTDPIILLLPQTFFRSCAILILAAVLLACTACILFDLYRKEHDD